MILKKLIAAGLTSAMIVSLVPFSSLAGEGGPGVSIPAESWDEDSVKPYIISSAHTSAVDDDGQPGWVLYNNGSYKYRNEDLSFAANTSLSIDDHSYRFGADGFMITGWWSADNGDTGWYYYYEKGNADGAPEGAMAVSTTIDGYRVNANGLYIGDSNSAASAVLDQVGWDLRAAYNWSAGLKYYRFTADPNQGVNWFADYGFTNHYGNCYVMAATFCQMARLLGYDARQMAGLVPSKRGGLVPHSWCELQIDGQTRVFDPNFTNETGKNGYNFTYGTSGTWRYQSYYAMHD